MNYGFAIDNQRCIGCHACSTACKSENDVPLGVDRTWVKYIERGVYPDVRRSFQVTRCNHCANPPCVRICPVTAMIQRDDGIVEFDADRCIGCKACMQACPYDAIYIDPQTHTAAKCHYCAHRVEIGLEPACVVVCPTHAIIAGDLDDPRSELAAMLAQRKSTVRKPEQGTEPKLFYLDGESAALDPPPSAAPPRQMMWADVVGDERRAASPQPAQGSGRVAGQMVQVAYNAQHAIPWHWQVPAYLVTKAIGAGIFIFLALGWGLRLFPFDRRAMIGGGLLSLLATLATTALLVADLERPARFIYVLLRPQWRSWLTRGAFILVGFAAISGLWWAAETAGALGWIAPPVALRGLLGWSVLALAIGAAIYTAFLFAQAEGRDLWQSPLLPFHLLVQSLAAGSGTLLMLDATVTLSPPVATAARVCFSAALVIDLFVTLVGELSVPHASEIAARAAREIRSGRYRGLFWWGSIVAGHALPLALLLAGFAPLAALGGALAIAGLYCYEHAFVMAPQEIPNS